MKTPQRMRIRTNVQNLLFDFFRRNQTDRVPMREGASYFVEHCPKYQNLWNLDSLCESIPVCLAHFCFPALAIVASSRFSLGKRSFQFDRLSIIHEHTPPEAAFCHVRGDLECPPPLSRTSSRRSHNRLRRPRFTQTLYRLDKYRRSTHSRTYISNLISPSPILSRAFPHKRRFISPPRPRLPLPPRRLTACRCPLALRQEWFQRW